MLKIFNLARTFLARPLFCANSVIFQFHTLKTTSTLPSLFKFKDLHYKPIKCVGGHRKKPAETTFKTWRVIKGDKVIVRSGKDKGKSGVVYKVYRKQNRVLVSGINIVKKLENDR